MLCFPAYQNKYNLAAEHSFSIELIDVNDKFPKFSKEINSGLVLENEPPGAAVMQVSAVDEDVTDAFHKVSSGLNCVRGRSSKNPLDCVRRWSLNSHG